jgi:hypothetical protein
MSWRRDFDAARDPYTARNALGILSTSGGGGGGIPEAPTDGTIYGRRGSDTSWQPSPPGATGPSGPAGANGATGPAGPGVPVGGTAGQLLTKNTATNYDTIWTTPASGGNVSNSGAPAAGQVAEWVTATTIRGVSTYAKLASPTFTGAPTAPTPTPATDSTTNLATTAFVQAAIAAVQNAKSLFVAKLPADQTGYGASAYALVNFTSAIINQGGNYNTTTMIWTPPAGRILLTGNLHGNTPSAAIVGVQINKNGAAWRNFTGYIPTTDASTVFTAFDIATGADSYQLYAYFTSGGTMLALGSYWQGALL